MKTSMSRADREYARKAKHEAAIEAEEAANADPVTKRIAFAICSWVYGACCACEKRPDMHVCSSMTGAARSATRIIRGD